MRRVGDKGEEGGRETRMRRKGDKDVEEGG